MAQNLRPRAQLLPHKNTPMLKSNERVEEALLKDLTAIDHELANELSQERKLWTLRSRTFIVAALDLLLYCKRGNIKVSACDLLKVNRLDGLVQKAMLSPRGSNAARVMNAYLGTVPAYREQAVGHQSGQCAEMHRGNTLIARNLTTLLEIERAEWRSKKSVPLLLALISGAMMSFGLFTDPRSETVLQALERDPSTFLAAMAGTLGLSVTMIWAELRSRRERDLMPLGREIKLKLARAFQAENSQRQGHQEV